MAQLSSVELKAVRDLLDKQAIYENVVKYCRGIDRLDLDLLKDSYWEDGTDDHGGFVGNTHDFCEHAVATKGMFKSVNHHVSNTQIELLGHQAKVETYFIAAHVIPGSGSQEDRFWLLGGRYKDLYEKRAGQWKILHRVCLWDWNQDLVDQTNWEKFDFLNGPNRGNFAPDDPIYGGWCPV